MTGNIVCLFLTSANVYKFKQNGKEKNTAYQNIFRILFAIHIYRQFIIFVTANQYHDIPNFKYFLYK